MPYDNPNAGTERAAMIRAKTGKDARAAFRRSHDPRHTIVSVRAVRGHPGVYMIVYRSANG